MKKIYYYLIVAFLILILILSMRELSKAQSFSDYQEYVSAEGLYIYCQDSIHVDSTTYDKSVIICFKYEDMTTDSIFFNLTPYNASLYDPRLHTIYRLSSLYQKTVMEHFLCMLNYTRKQRILFTQKP